VLVDIDALTTHTASESLIILDNTKSAILEALCDQNSRKILSSILLKSLSIQEICFEQDIAPSTCYRRMRALLADGIVVRKLVMSQGKKSSSYAATFKSVTIGFDSGKLEVGVSQDVPIGGASQVISIPIIA
jgi:DNA-binding HxlR family transcriptional regulator